MTSQRHSALISSDSEQFQFWFSAVYYLKISEQRWKRKFSELKISAGCLWNSADSELNSTDLLCNISAFWRLKNDNFWLLVNFFEIFKSTSMSRHIFKIFKPICAKTLTTKISWLFSRLMGQCYKKNSNVCVSLTAQVTKLIWFNFSKKFPSSQMNFQNYLKNI